MAVKVTKARWLRRECEPHWSESWEALLVGCPWHHKIVHTDLFKVPFSGSAFSRSILKSHYQGKAWGYHAKPFPAPIPSHVPSGRDHALQGLPLPCFSWDSCLGKVFNYLKITWSSKTLRECCWTLNTKFTEELQAFINVYQPRPCKNTRVCWFRGGPQHGAWPSASTDNPTCLERSSLHSW